MSDPLPPRSVFDATSRAITLMGQHFVPLFVVGIVAALPSMVLWTALERFALSHVSFELDQSGAIKLIAEVAGAGLAVMVVLLLVEALMWGALSETLSRIVRHEPDDIGASLSFAGAKFTRYFASYCTFLIPAATVGIALMVLGAVVALAPGLGTGALLGIGTLIALPVYAWAMGFSLMLVPAAIRGHFGAEGFATYWHELKGQWMELFGLQLMLYALGIGLAIGFGILKMFLPDTPSLDWSQYLNGDKLQSLQNGNWQDIVEKLLHRPEDWRNYLRDAVDVVRDGLLFAFAGTLAVCWYLPRDTFNPAPAPLANGGKRESETPRSPTSAP